MPPFHRLQLVVQLFQESWPRAGSKQRRETTRSGAAPLETVFGVREVPVETAAVVRAAIDRMVKDGTVQADEPWLALDVLAARAQQ